MGGGRTEVEGQEGEGDGSFTNMDLLNALLEDMITYSRADSGLITLDMTSWRGGGRRRR
jgi:hypothetical protein